MVVPQIIAISPQTGRPRQNRHTILLALLAFAVAGGPTESSGQTLPAPAARETTGAASMSGGSYVIGPGDKLEIHILGRPQLTRDSVQVDSQGRIRMPFLKEPVAAACATESDLENELAKRYAEYLIDPQITVAVREYSSKAVELVGAVTKPGSFQLQREVRLRELLSIAGGLRPNAGMFAQLVHDESAPLCEPMTGDAAAPETREETTVSSINLYELMRGQGANPLVRPGDFIHVPEADQAFVVGHVVKPTAIPLTQPMTVSRAVAMAGGRQPGSKDHVRLIRPNPGGTASTEIRVDLKAIEQRAAQDVELLPGDIVDVPVSQGKQLLRSVIYSAITVGFYYPLLIIN